MSIFKSFKNSNGETSTPSVEQSSLIAAALVSLIARHVNAKPRLTVLECMKHAGISTSVASNKALQMRVHRLVTKLHVQSVLAAVDDTLLVMHGIQPAPVETQQEAVLERALKAAVLIHLIDISVRDTPLLTAYDCMIHAGLPPVVAKDPTSLLLVRRLVDLLDLDEVLFRVDEILDSRRGMTTPPDEVQVRASYSV